MPNNDYTYINTSGTFSKVNLVDLCNELLACNFRDIQINADILAIFNSVRSGEYVNLSAIKTLQQFCNASILEHLFIEQNRNLSFLTGDHDIVVLNGRGQNKPDFILNSGKFRGRTVELKIYNSVANISFEHVHNADFVICYIFGNSTYHTFGKVAPNDYIELEWNLLELNFPSGFKFVYLTELNSVGRSKLGKYPQNTKTLFNEDRNIHEAFGSAYSNNLDLTKALQNKDYCIELIKDFYGYDGPIETGGFYILPDGTAVKSANHMDIDNLLIRYHYINRLDKEPMQYGDGSQFMDAINCVRIRRRGGKDSWILPYMILPENQLTPMQYSVIED